MSNLITSLYPYLPMIFVVGLMLAAAKVVSILRQTDDSAGEPQGTNPIMIVIMAVFFLALLLLANSMTGGRVAALLGVIIRNPLALPMVGMFAVKRMHSSDKGIYTTASIKDHGVMGAGKYIVHTGKTIKVGGRNIYHQTNIYGKGRLGGTRYETRKGKVVSCKTMFKTTWHINYVTPDSDEWKIKAFKAVSSKAAEKHASDYCLRHGYTLLCVW